ncbi:MAG: type II toxin-antitoxin system VapC family toxin [Bacteroidetes bacterium]|nr:type II toxin-antitoxin system VapC family toxin [Bacteroidota bacterium]
MIIVLDASAAIEIALGNELSAQFKKLLQDAELIIAPDTFISEVTNTFWKYRKFAQFTDEVCLKGIEFCLGLVDDFASSTELWKEAFLEGNRYQHSTYDLFYLVAARRHHALLLTKDKKLNEIAIASGINIFSLK